MTCKAEGNSRSQNNSQFMKSSGHIMHNFGGKQNNSFNSRHFDLTKGNMNTSAYAKKTYHKQQKSQYNSRMNKTRSTKHLLRSQKQSTNHAQNDTSKGGNNRSDEELRLDQTAFDDEDVRIEEAHVRVQLDRRRRGNELQLEPEQHVPHEELSNTQATQLLDGPGRNAESPVH